MQALAQVGEAGVKVVTSILPLHSLVAGVMEATGEPTLLVGGAASPHAYSLKPSEARALADADKREKLGGSTSRVPLAIGFTAVGRGHDRRCVRRAESAAPRTGRRLGSR